MSIRHGALPAVALRVERADERATESAERAGVLQWPAAALRMATRTAASALLAAALHAAAILKRPRGYFQVCEWERERVIHIALLDRASQLYSEEW
ncbi:hypothetical protein R1flu_000824 [Riccia fluitans]|uniref:Uncharacterized protein n=1 Tax=Riccia fluitans TaxID=41844 RepID=A0ABD1Y2H8_9MARC